MGKACCLLSAKALHTTSGSQCGRFLRIARFSAEEEIRHDLSTNSAENAAIREAPPLTRLFYALLSLKSSNLLFHYTIVR